MLIISIFILAALACVGQAHVPGDSALAPPPSDGLSDLRQVLRPAIAHNKLSDLHNRPISLLGVLYRSRWRNSIRDVVRLLIQSSDADERIVGWQLAQEYRFAMEWTESDIDKIAKEPIDAVKIAAMRSVAITDVAWLTTCAERVLKDPAVTTSCKDACVRLLPEIPTLSHRVGLWLLAAGDAALRAACVDTFPSVASSESAIQVVAGYLDDMSTVNVAISDDFGWPTELRILACQALSTVDVHKERTVAELQKRCEMSPERRHLEFFIAAMIAIHTLDPGSSKPIDQTMKWYDELRDARPIVLQGLEGQFSGSHKFEALVISRAQEISPKQRYCVCQWLSNRRSREATTALRELLRDSHPGVRVAAAAALTKADPLFDLSTTREDLLQVAVSSPKNFMIAFSSMSDAVSTLALAGQSDEDAIKWLKLNRDPDLRAICGEALEALSTEMATGRKRDIPWKNAADGQ